MPNPKQTLLPLLIIGILLATYSLVKAQNTSNFADVSTNHEHAEAINDIKRKGLVQGYEDGRFKPGQNINRVEFLKILLQATNFNRQCGDYPIWFQDTEANGWYYPYLHQAVTCGIVQGYPNNQFKPADAIKYGEAAKITTLLYGIPLAEENPDDLWYERYLYALDQQNAEPNETIDFGDNLTRGQMAQLIFNLQDFKPYQARAYQVPKFNNGYAINKPDSESQTEGSVVPKTQLTRTPVTNQNTIDANNFGAYYTSISKGEAWEAASRTREHADIIVNLTPDTKVEFWRGTSYSPVLVHNGKTTPFKEIVQRSGDGNAKMPDRTNRFSHVKIIEQSAEQALIQWRYLPIFDGGNPSTTNSDLFVDELFMFRSDGLVGRIIRQGTANPDAWNDPDFVIKEAYKIDNGKIQLVSSQDLPNSFTQAAKVVGNPVKFSSLASPSAWWKFDEGQGQKIADSISRQNTTVKGPKVYWAKGVSGTAISLDGYNNFIDATLDTNIQGDFTIEAWVALAAAPFEEIGLLAQGDMGIYTTAEGDLIFTIGEESIYSEDEFLKGRYGQWVHIVATLNNGEAKLYVDGNVIAEGELPSHSSTEPLKIGYTETLFAGTTPFTIEGLIDEVRMYNTVLSQSQVQQSFNDFNPVSFKNRPDLQMAQIPEGQSKNTFGAHYEKLHYTNRWDNLHRDSQYADIVVNYENSPAKTVFWRAATYSPFHTNGSKGRFNSEFNENFGPDGSDNDCCYEPMSDKKHEFSYARIIENTPARVVVHWRYPQLFPDKRLNNYAPSTGWGDISDWYMYIYPDGVNAYDMWFWSNDRKNFVEWSEGMMLVGPGEDPRSVLPFKGAVTNADQNKTRVWDWSDDPDTLDQYSWDNDPQTIKPLIQTVNFKGKYKAFMAFAEENVRYWGPYIAWDRLTHWPVGQRQSSLEAEKDGLNTRTAHYSLLKTIPPEFAENGGHHKTGTVKGGGYVSQIRLEGMTDRTLDELRHVQKSWANAPEPKDLSGLSGKYHREQRAYVFQSTANNMSFTLPASSTQPLDNPALVIKDWNHNQTATIKVNSQEVNNAKQGITLDTDGRQKLVIYVPMTANTTQEFEIIKP